MKDAIDTQIPTRVPTGRVASDEPDDLQKRLQLIRKYRQQGMENEDVRGANFAAINAGLMRVAARLEVYVERSLEQAEGHPESFGSFERKANLQLRVVRQIGQIEKAIEESSEAGK